MTACRASSETTPSSVGVAITRWSRASATMSSTGRPAPTPWTTPSTACRLSPSTWASPAHRTPAATATRPSRTSRTCAAQPAEHLRSNNGPDRLTTLNGNDIVEGRGGNDTLDAGAGEDVLDVRNTNRQRGVRRGSGHRHRRPARNRHAADCETTLPPTPTESANRRPTCVADTAAPSLPGSKANPGASRSIQRARRKQRSRAPGKARR